MKLTNPTSPIKPMSQSTPMAKTIALKGNQVKKAVGSIPPPISQVQAPSSAQRDQLARSIKKTYQVQHTFGVPGAK